MVYFFEKFRSILYAASSVLHAINALSPEEQPKY